MEILFVSRPILPPWNEGSKNLTWQIASRLKRHRAHLMTTKDGFQGDLEKNQLHRTYTDHRLTIKQKVRMLNSLIMKPPPADIYHFYFVPTVLTSKILSSVSFLRRKKTVQTIPCIPEKLPSQQKMKEVFFADQIVVYSQFTKERLADWGVNNVTKINVGIDVSHHDECKPDPLFRKRLGLGNDDILILFSGEYTRLGSVDILKRAMREVITRDRRCHFIVACRILSKADMKSETELKAYVYRQKIIKNVHFTGEVSSFASLLKSCDILFYPVKAMVGKIDTPLVILEAMAAGLPVVSHNVNPLNEMFGNSYLLDSDDAGAERLLYFASAREIRQREGDYLRSIAKERFGLDEMVEAYEVLYDSLG